jgi:inner membrane protein
MASFFTHPAYPVALALSKRVPISKRLLILCIILTCLPDADVIAFKFGISYGSQWGHRGFTHSLAMAGFVGWLCSKYSSRLRASKKLVFWLTSTSWASHIVMDALTNGGLGVAVFWPLSSERHFLPWQVVEVSPIGVRNFLSLRGLVVVWSEILWLWMPCLLMSYLVRFRERQRKNS